MSCSTFVDGYTQTGYAQNETIVRRGDVFIGSTVVFECADGRECVGAGGGYETYTLTTNVANLATGFPTADYFRVGISLEQWGLYGLNAGQVCATVPLPTKPCDGQAPNALTSVNFRWSLGCTESANSAAGVEFDSATSGGFDALEELRLGVSLLNTAPSFPVPDATGNEIGNVLFTAAQLPTSVSMTCRRRFYVYRPADTANVNLELVVGIRPYYSNVVPVVSSEGLMCVL